MCLIVKTIAFVLICNGVKDAEDMEGEFEIEPIRRGESERKDLRIYSTLVVSSSVSSLVIVIGYTCSVCIIFIIVCVPLVLTLITPHNTYHRASLCDRQLR